MVTNKTFQQAINMLKELMETRHTEQVQQAKKIWDAIRQNQEVLILETLQATIAHIGKDIGQQGEPSSSRDTRVEEDQEEKLKERRRQQQEKEERSAKMQDIIKKAKEVTDKLTAELANVEENKRLNKAKVEANRIDIFELNETTGPWVTNMSQDEAIIIKSWIAEFKEDHIANLYKIPNVDILKVEEKEHTRIEKVMHRKCLDALSGGRQGKLTEKPTAENKFDIGGKGRFGWVPHGELFHWSKQQQEQNASEKDAWTEDNFWNMILHTQCFVNKQYQYSVKFWPSVGMVMIKAVTVQEKEWQTSKRKWAAEGYEGMLDSDEDAGKEHSQWPAKEADKEHRQWPKKKYARYTKKSR